MSESLKVSDFYYDLPKELIAQDPLAERSASRLLVLDKKSGEITHRSFSDIKEYLTPGDCLVLNNTKVIPARLLGRKEETDAQVELLLLKRLSDDTWEPRGRCFSRLLASTLTPAAWSAAAIVSPS